MNARYHPNSDQSVVRYHKRHKADFDKALESISRSLKDDFIGLFLLPNGPENRSQGSAKKRKASSVPSFVAIVGDIIKGDIAKLAMKRESVIKDAFAASNLPVHNLSVLHVSGLWSFCCDATANQTKLDPYLKGVVLADNWFLPAFLLALHQKDRVVERFEKYVVCYCFSGSSVRGTRTTRSDLDVFCVIDDTDIKKMTLAELKDKLRAIIVGMGHELAQEFDIPLNLNVQVYVLTDFWEALRDSNPIIFTMVRDGVPLYDRGTFVAWKRLLATGRIRCSTEGTLAYARTADGAFDAAGNRISTAATEDLYYSLLCYAQAILACQGSAPSAPSETVREFRTRFCKPPHNFDRQAFRTLSKLVRLRKLVEHGHRRRVNASQVAELHQEVKAAKTHFASLYRSVEAEDRRRREASIREYLDAQLRRAVVQLAERHPAIRVDEASLFVHGLPTPRGMVQSVLASLKKGTKKATPERLESLTRQAVAVGDAVSQAVDVLVSDSAEFADLGDEGGRWLLACDGEAVTALPLDWSRFATPLRAETAPGARAVPQFQKADLRDLLVKRTQYLRMAGEKRRSYDIDSIRAALRAVSREA